MGIEHQHWKSTLWSVDMAMENDPFIDDKHDDLPIMGIGWGHIGYTMGMSSTMDISWEYIGI